MTAYAVYRDVFGKIHQVNVTGLGPAAQHDNALNIWIGSTRAEARTQVRQARRQPALQSWSCTAPGLAVVMSIPRDSVAPVLACHKEPGSPGQVAQPGQIEQINETYSNGGPGCLWKTIEHMTHIRLNHFAELNFTGFEHVINDLGGVRICLPFPINDPRSKLHLTAGIHHVGGAKALAYWRVRYIGVGSDLERIQRDQFLMASVAQKVKHTGLLGNPAKIFRIVRDVAASLTTDSGLKQTDTIALAERLRALPLGHAPRAGARRALRAEPELVQWRTRRASLPAIAQTKLPRPARHGPSWHERTGAPPANRKAAVQAVRGRALAAPAMAISARQGRLAASAGRIRRCPA
jgi:LCP family protein required for cell wall assembly